MNLTYFLIAESYCSVLIHSKSLERYPVNCREFSYTWTQLLQVFIAMNVNENNFIAPWCISWYFQFSTNTSYFIFLSDDILLN